MPWPKVQGCPDYLGMNWIHPLKQKVVAAIVEQLKEECPDIEALAVFGSSTRNDCNVYSDLDLVVWKPDTCRFTPNCENYDLLFANHISRESAIWQSILEEGVVVYVKNPCHQHESEIIQEV